MTNGSFDTSVKPGSTIVPQLGVDTSKTEWMKTSDGVAHFVRCWQGAIGAPVAVYLHGIEGHSRWFQETAERLGREGIWTYAPDRRGAGESREKSGHIRHFEQLVKDAEELVLQISRRHPSSHVFLVANCWGAKVAIMVAANLSKTGGRFSVIRGLALTSPAVAVKVDAPFATKVQIGLNYLFGGTAYFDVPLTPEHFTDNPPYLEYVANDPLRLKRATAAFFVESLKLTSACKRASVKLEIPILVLQSGRDAIVDLAGIEQWFNSLSTGDKTLEIFSSAAHSLDFDKDAAKYQDALSSWIMQRATRS